MLPCCMYCWSVTTYNLLCYINAAVDIGRLIKLQKVWLSVINCSHKAATTPFFMPPDPLIDNWDFFSTSTGTSLWSLTWSRCARSAMRSSPWSWRRGWRSCPKLWRGSEHTALSLEERKQWGSQFCPPSTITWDRNSLFVLHLGWLL